MTPQQNACAALWCWQELRDRKPAERIRILVERELLPPDNDNEDELEVVRETMSNG